VISFDIRAYLENLTMSDLDLETILGELRQREPIFHRRAFGTSRDDLEAMTAEDFFEIGASGRIYQRDFVIANLLERYQQPERHDWPCRDFSIRRLAENLYLLNYTLDPAGRRSEPPSGKALAGAGKSSSIREPLPAEPPMSKSREAWN
jgi:hypothetical protein